MINVSKKNIITSKLIFSPQLANYLLQHGFDIIKIKPKKDAENKSVFAFRVDNGFFEVIEDWKDQIEE